MPEEFGKGSATTLSQHQSKFNSAIEAQEIYVTQPQTILTPVEHRVICHFVFERDGCAFRRVPYLQIHKNKNYKTYHGY